MGFSPNWCSCAGERIDYRTSAGRYHLSVLADDSPMIDDLVTWTRERFAGTPALDACLTTPR